MFRSRHSSSEASGRPMQWRAILRSGSLLEGVLLGRWTEDVRVYRWKWLAEAIAARHRRRRRGKRGMTVARVEAYRPGANILPFRPGERSSRPVESREP